MSETSEHAVDDAAVDQAEEPEDTAEADGAGADAGTGPEL